MSGTINGNAVAGARVHVGTWGAWWSDVGLPDAVALSGAVTLVIGDTTMKGTVISGGVANGAAGYRVVGGAGGLGKMLSAKSYADDQGVKLSKVVLDAAREAGETIDASTIPTTRLGPQFTRRADIMSRVLNDVAQQAWRVDFDGVIRFGVRPSTTYTGSGARTRVDPLGGVVEIATEQIAALVPGVSVDGSAPATDIEIMLDAKRLTVRVYAGLKNSRRNDAMTAVFRALFPELQWAGTFEFRVIAQNGNRFSLQPVRTGTGMPLLNNVPARGPAGIRETVTPGELVLVSFVDRDPSRPAVVSHDAWDAPAWMPLFLELGGPGALGVARIGDTVQAGPYTGVITSGSARVKAAL